jgi:hypothetical protein
MTTFDKAPKEAYTAMQELLDECEEFAPLVESKCEVEIWFATGSERKDGTRNQALTHGGYPATALAKVIRLQDRVAGLKDARITVDALWWQGATEQQRKALLHHELTHFEPVTDDTGAYEYDDASRVKLKCRKHSVQVGWFYSTAKRFGAASLECIQLKEIIEESGQFMLPLGLAPKQPEITDDETATAVDFAASARKLANAVSGSRAVAAQ